MKELETGNKSYQSWMLVNIDDAGQDAVSIHMSNLNRDNDLYENHRMDLNG